MSPRVSDEHKEQRREQILQAAARCFLRRGYAETTMHEILVEADLSTGAVYNYFASKAELYTALLDQSVNDLIRAYQAELPEKGSAWQKLRHLVHVHFVSFRSDRQHEATRLYLLDFLPASVHDETLRRHLRRRNEAIHRLFRDRLAEGIELGEFAPIDPEVTAALILAAGDGVRLHALTTGTLSDADRMFQNFVANLELAITREPAQPQAGASKESANGGKQT